ncbi:MAG TPA: metal ABC transporter ATP-binding protein [Trueperaceae bacterium]|nr:metal ABC transporter ATP-binding protein [Trueperaceae bacterium]
MFLFKNPEAQHKHDHNPLELIQVDVSYQELGNIHYALHNINFTIQNAEQIAIVGPNGAGKSTLLKVIAGILTADQGKVLIFGSEASKHNCIAYVPQRNQVDWTFPVTVEDVVMMGRTRHIGFFKRAKKNDYEVVKKSLARVGILDLAHKQIGELSGGQQQRVFIARALALETQLLLLDEPLAGLDIPSQKIIFDILADLRNDNVTILMAIHDLNLSKKFDRTILLNKEIIAIGKSDKILSPQNLLKAFGGNMVLKND